MSTSGSKSPSHNHTILSTTTILQIHVGHDDLSTLQGLTPLSQIRPPEGGQQGSPRPTASCQGCPGWPAGCGTTAHLSCSRERPPYPLPPSVAHPPRCRSKAGRKQRRRGSRCGRAALLFDTVEGGAGGVCFPKSNTRANAEVGALGG